MQNENLELSVRGQRSLGGDLKESFPGHLLRSACLSRALSGSLKGQLGHNFHEFSRESQQGAAPEAAVSPYVLALTPSEVCELL